MLETRSSRNPRLLSELPLEANTYLLPLETTILLIFIVAIWFAFNSKTSEYPLANAPSWFQPTYFKRLEFLKNGFTIYCEAKKRYGDSPYRLITENGEALILSSNDIRHVQSEKNLAFGEAIAIVGSL